MVKMRQMEAFFIFQLIIVKMKQMEAFFIFQLFIITRAGYIEIGWKLVRSAPFFTENPNLASEWPKTVFSKSKKIVAWVIAMKHFC